jgi:alpha-ketoglutarate-dependent 2,4-dichlorophenoxyacetate dioxygenase
MALEIRPLHPLLGVEIVGVDVTRVDADAFARIVDAFEEHSVLLFRGQTLDDAAQIAFSRRFGPLETTIRTVVSHVRYRPEISNLANVDGEDRLIPRGDRRNLFNAGNQIWHTDSSFKRVPALASLLSGREVPPKGGPRPSRAGDSTRARLRASMAPGRPGDVGQSLRATSRPTLEREPLPPRHASHDRGRRGTDGRRGRGHQGCPSSGE